MIVHCNYYFDLHKGLYHSLFGLHCHVIEIRLTLLNSMTMGQGFTFSYQLFEQKGVSVLVICLVNI